MKVAVIGAGISGLAAIKSCLEEGLDPEAYEQNDDVGGVFLYTEIPRGNDGASVYEQLITNVSKASMSYSDFPFPPESPLFLPHKVYQKYLRSYAENFGLLSHINFNCRILAVKPTDDYEATGNWTVEVSQNGSVSTHVYNAVIVCTGYFRKQFIPKLDGLDKFKGDIVHSGEFKKGTAFADKNVIVVGGSFSAGDMAAHVAPFSNKTFLSMRRGAYICRLLGRNGWPWDFMFNRNLLCSSPSALEKVFHDVLDLDSFINHPNYSMRPTEPILKARMIVSDQLSHHILCGKVALKPKLVRVTESTAEFADGTVVENVNAILFATGFKIDFSIVHKCIKTDTEGDFELYRLILPANMPHRTLAFVGAMSGNVSVPPVYEIQARWAAHAIAGRLDLPSKEDMMKEIEKRREENRRPEGRVCYYFFALPYQEQLADEIGVLPSFDALSKSDPALAHQFMFGPCIHYFYRLQGPGKWEGAERTIKNIYDNTRASTQARGVRANTIYPE